jgi:hypothetical protein
MEVYRSKARFRVVVAGRRWGKSALSRVEMIKHAKKRKSKIWYVAPTYRMAKQIMWTDLLDAIPNKWIRSINQTTLMITLVNGTTIELKGADKADSLRGVGVDFLVLDEFQDISEETWTKVLRPTLADRRGLAIFIGTPKAYNYLYDVYKRGQNKANVEQELWESWQFPTITSPFIPISEIEAAMQDMDEKSFKQEFEACHLPETKVRTWSGKEKEIRHISQGDVLSYKDERGDVYPCRVIKVGVTGVKQIVDVTLETGEVISASNHHKFKVHANE